MFQLFCANLLKHIYIYVFQIENLGIDWDGPVGLDDDSSVIVDDIESPLSQEESNLLDLFLTTFDNHNDDEDNTLYDKYLFCLFFINIFH